MFETLVTIGSIFSVLTLVHFSVDWLFQSEWEATNKAKSTAIRTMHCVIYTLPFVLVFFALGLSWTVLLLSTMILFMSHNFIDTYIPTFWWAKYIRRMKALDGDYQQSKLVFKYLWKEPIYPILFIVVDQIFHILFVFLVSVIIVLFRGN